MNEMTSIPALMAEIGANAKAAAAKLAFATAESKKTALLAAADAVSERCAEIIEANEKDMAYAEEKGLSTAMLDRLMLNEARVAAIAESLRAVAGQDDPVGEVIAEWDVPSGLHIRRVRTPLGVVVSMSTSRNTSGGHTTSW